jgi:hypothetical protein
MTRWRSLARASVAAEKAPIRGGRGLGKPVEGGPQGLGPDLRLIPFSLACLARPAVNRAAVFVRVRIRTLKALPE